MSGLLPHGDFNQSWWQAATSRCWRPVANRAASAWLIARLVRSYDKMSLKQARANKVTKVRTTCPYCGVGCNMDLNVSDGRVVRVTSNPDAPVNGMALCVKGRYGYDFVHHPDRLTRPQVRRYLLEGGQKGKGESGMNGSKSIGTLRLISRRAGCERPATRMAPIALGC